MERSGRNRRDLLLLLALWLGCLLLDGLWLQRHHLPPAWDQGDHLSRALGVWRVLQQPLPWSGAWWQELWAQTPTYRGPLTYLLTAPVLELLGPSYRSAMAANGLFNALLLASVYGQGRLLASRAAGLWAAWFCALAPALLNQRTDYLIDFSLTAVISGCWWLLSARRWLPLRRPWLWSGACGLGLGAVLLTRPTGLMLLWLPLLLLGLRALMALGQRNPKPFLQGLLALLAAWAVAGPWFSQNWLTILSTINKARQWGVAYQEGLEANSLDGWLYYPRLLPTMAGSTVVALVLAGGALALLQGRGRLGGPLPAGRLLWWLSFPLGGLLICVLMSSKDFRFVLPLLPQLAVGLGLVVAAVQRRWALPWRAALLGLGLAAALHNQFGWGRDLSGFPPHRPNGQRGWPVAEIVATIGRQSPHQLSTLAVLPDSEQLNAFNLEAEGRAQGFRVAARQTVAPLEQLSNDLSAYDWFLVKGGDQGVMSDERQAQLAQRLKASPDFLEAGRWLLPDGSTTVLLRREPLSLAAETSPCGPGRWPSLSWTLGDAQPLRAGSTAALNLELLGQPELLQQGRLLLAWQQQGGSGQWRADHAIGQGMLRPQPQPAKPARCLRVQERLAVPLPADLPSGRYRPEAFWLPPSGRPIPLAAGAATVEVLPPDAAAAASAEGASLASNRVSELVALGRQLRSGELDALFSRVGQLNQSDPDQVYLKDGEAILRARLTQNQQNLNDLYALALAQALQRQASDAAVTLQQLTQLDPRNPNALLGLGVVQLYRFDAGAAQVALNRAAQLDPDNPTLRTLRIVASALRLDLPQALSLLQS